MSGTIRTLSTLQTTEFQDGQFKAISASDTRDGWESAFAIVPSAAGQQTANYTAVLSDRGCVVPFATVSGTTAANASYIIPLNVLPVNSVLGLLWVFGAAIQPQFSNGGNGSVVIRSPTGNNTVRAAVGIAWAWQYTLNTWYLLGDLT